MIATRTRISPPELARRWGIDTHKVLGWIRNGELHAIDASTRPGGRPRFLIDEKDIELFELRRAVGAPPVKMPRRHAKQSGIIEFF
ncbi:MAG: DNA-binding protein [Thermoguttaceae bacterium]